MTTKPDPIDLDALQAELQTAQSDVRNAEQILNTARSLKHEADIRLERAVKALDVAVAKLKE